MTAETSPGRAPSHHYYGRPVYRCRECGDRYERVGNLTAVEQHEAQVHGYGQAAEPRESAFILGPDGQPAVIA